MFDSRLLVVFTLQLEILVTTLFTPPPPYLLSETNNCVIPENIHAPPPPWMVNGNS